MRKYQVNYAGRFESDSNVGYHSHPGPELIYFHKGKCRIHVQEQTFDLVPQDVLIIPAKYRHDQVNKGKVIDTYIRCEVPLNPLMNQPSKINCSGDTLLPRWFEDMCHLSQAESHDWQAEGQTLLQGIMLRLQRHAAEAQSHAAAPPALLASKQFIEANISTILTVEDIAEKVHLSASHLTRLWRDHMGCPPLRYQQNLRMQLAKSLLNNDYLRINEVAQHVGYDDENYFGRVFKKRFGMSPGAWRKKK